MYYIEIFKCQILRQNFLLLSKPYLITIQLGNDASYNDIQFLANILNLNDYIY